MEDRICLITGATDGIGKATALKLALQGYKVVITGRNRDKIQDVIKKISGIYKNARLDFIQADLSDISQVETLIETIKSRYSKLDVLINNAGVVTPRYKLTRDGLENTYQVNYLSPFILTNGLLPLIEKSNAGRIVNVVSSVYTVGSFGAESIGTYGKYSAIRAYANSKLYLLMFTEELARRVGNNVTVNAMHPGIVKTNMSTQLEGYPFLFRLISAVAMPFAITPEKASETAVLLASGDSVKDLSGKFFTGSDIVKIRHKDDIPENRRLLWDYSMSYWIWYKRKASI